MKPLKHTVMNNISRIFILIAAALPFALPCSGQKPEPLTFTKTYQMPGMKQDELYRYTAGWHTENECGLEFDGSGYGYSEKNYHASYENVILGGKKGKILVFVDLVFADERMDVFLREVFVSWKNGNRSTTLSVCDDKFNRNWLWRTFHSQEVLDDAREKAPELFQQITASMDRFLAEGPPMELRAME